MRIFTSTASFARPNNTTAYGSGDIIGQSASLATVPMTFTLPVEGFLLTNVKVKMQTISSLGATSSLILHLYRNVPTTVPADGNPFLTDECGYLGNVFIDLVPWANFFNDNHSGLGPIDPNLMPILSDNTAGVPPNQIYGLLMTNDNLTPLANQLFTTTLIGYD